MADTFEKSFVRIRNVNGTTAGAGFMVDEKHIVTCAHVVQYALALGSETILPKESKIQVEYPFISPVKVLSSRPIRYETSNDLAVLELMDSLPAHACPALIAMDNHLSAHAFKVYGYPEYYNEKGVWAYGEIKDALGDGTVQLQVKELTGEAIKQGFSGGPVWDEQLQRVVGMIAISDKDIRLAFMIPIQAIAQVWPIGAKVATPIVNPTINQQELVKLLLACPSINNPHDRQTIIDDLPPNIKNNIKYNASAKMHISNIVTTCLNYAMGLQSLVEKLAFFEGEDSLPVQKLQKFLNNG